MIPAKNGKIRKMTKSRVNKGNMADDKEPDQAEIVAEGEAPDEWLRCQKHFVQFTHTRY